jgi:hypothetical protein
MSADQLRNQNERMQANAEFALVCVPRYGCCIGTRFFGSLRPGLLGVRDPVQPKWRYRTRPVAVRKGAGILRKTLLTRCRTSRPMAVLVAGLGYRK